MAHFARRNFIRRSALLALLLPSLVAKASAQSDNPTTQRIHQWYLTPDGWVPNHPELPVMHIASSQNAHQALLTGLVDAGWSRQWQGKPYNYLHYHSRTHAIFVVTAGSGELRVGGYNGKIIPAKAGDLIFLPAGTGQQNIAASPDFAVIAFYPHGKTWDVCRSAINPETFHRVSEEHLNKSTRNFFSQHGVII